MAHRQKNLLEAFNASAAIEKEASERDEAKAGGPFAPDASDASDGPDAVGAGATGRDPDLPGEKLSITATLLQPENRNGLMILLGLGLTLAFLAGRASKGRVVAAEKTGTPTEETSRASVPPRVVPAAPAEVAADEPAPERELTEAEEALVDPENRFTIKLCEYQRDRDEDLAWANFHYLEDLGLPAAMLVRGKRLFVVIGAASSQAGLDELLRRAKSMTGPPPRSKAAEFSDAYVVMIDSVLDR